MRRAIARRMTESKQQAPHFYVETDVPMDAVLTTAAARAISVTAILVRACACACACARARALLVHPELNAVWTESGLERSGPVNVGVAVALDGGLIAPAVLGAEALSLDETAATLSDIVGRARSGKQCSARSSAPHAASASPTATLAS